jgi:hypothetical protein
VPSDPNVMPKISRKRSVPDRRGCDNLVHLYDSVAQLRQFRGATRDYQLV